MQRALVLHDALRLVPGVLGGLQVGGAAVEVFLVHVVLAGEFAFCQLAQFLVQGVFGFGQSGVHTGSRGRDYGLVARDRFVEGVGRSVHLGLQLFLGLLVVLLLTGLVSRLVVRQHVLFRDRVVQLGQTPPQLILQFHDSYILLYNCEDYSSIVYTSFRIFINSIYILTSRLF